MDVRIKMERKQFWITCYLKAIDIYFMKNKPEVFDESGDEVTNSDIWSYCSNYANACVYDFDLYKEL